MIQELVTNLKESKENKYTKFGHFVATSLENLKDDELEEMSQIKIRMILSEMSNEAFKRQM